MRDRVEQARTEAIARARSSSDLEVYLSELQRHARKNGRATALDVEPGLAAIRTVLAQQGIDAVLARSNEFAKVMRSISSNDAK